MSSSNKYMDKANDRNTLYILITCTLLMMLNDIVFMVVIRPLPWILADYIFRIIVLFLMFLPIKKGQITTSDLAFKKITLSSLFIWTSILTVVHFYPIAFIADLLRDTFPGQSLINYPDIDNKLLKFTDMTFGLALVAFSEEILFRGYYRSVLKKYFNDPMVIMLISSICFGLIHWGLGWIDVAETAVWGFLVIFSVYRSGSIYPALLSHFLVNFVFFL